MLLPFQGVGLVLGIFTQSAALGYALIGLSARLKLNPKH